MINNLSQIILYLGVLLAFVVPSLNSTNLK